VRKFLALADGMIPQGYLIMDKVVCHVENSRWRPSHEEGHLKEQSISAWSPKKVVNVPVDKDFARTSLKQYEGVYL
jgi:hypothetical protein